MIQDHPVPPSYSDGTSFTANSEHDAALKSDGLEGFYKNVGRVKADPVAPPVPRGRLADHFATLSGARFRPSLLQTLEHAITTAGFSVAVVDGIAASRPIVMVNAAFERMTGYTAEEAIGSNLDFLAGPTTDLAMRKALQAALREGQPATVTVQHFARTGEAFWDSVQRSPVRESGMVSAYVCVMRDVGDLRRVEQALQLSREHLRAVVDHVSELVLIVEADLTVSYANPALLAVLGYSPLDILGRSLVTLVHEGDRGPIQNWLHARGTEGHRVPFEFQACHQDGSWRYLEATAGTLPAAGVATRTMISARNVTDLAILRERQTRLLLEATINGQEEERERICLDIHDGICQTLATAFQYLETLTLDANRQPEDFDRLRRGQELVRQGIRQAREIVASLRPARLDALGLVAALKYDIQDLGERTALTAVFRAEPIHLAGSVETALYRIVHEALTNVVKHARATRVDVALRVDDDSLIVEVRDDGIGFASKSTQTDLRSGGVGLIGMRRRAELLQGRFDVRSDVGQGTEVRVTMPLSAISSVAGG